jgi:hypothetical protein
MGTKRKRGVNPDGATILPDQPDALPSSNFHDARMAGNGPGNLCPEVGRSQRPDLVANQRGTAAAVKQQ